MRKIHKYKSKGGKRLGSPVRLLISVSSNPFVSREPLT